LGSVERGFFFDEKGVLLPSKEREGGQVKEKVSAPPNNERQMRHLSLPPEEGGGSREVS